MFSSRFYAVDWILLLTLLPIAGAGLVTMKAFGGGADYFFTRQLVWLSFGIGIYFFFSFVDWGFLRRSLTLLFLYGFGIALLGFLFLKASPVRGATSWIRIWEFNIEPAEPIKLILILLLAKYFSRRHVEIARVRHAMISGLYAAIPLFFILLQPDFGSAMVVGVIWLGMVFASGIPKKQLVALALLFALLFSLGWMFFLAPYQKLRILTFLDPLLDPSGVGYNAVQSVLAVGSGRLWGRGVGFGAQSRLGFLPEHETDFIFAAFAEEWGLVGVLFLLVLFSLLLLRILSYALRGKDNFTRLFGIGIAVFVATHAVIHAGMNVGLLPVTGIPFPFMSYGGSHIVTLFAGLGILVGLDRHAPLLVKQEWGEGNY